MSRSEFHDWLEFYNREPFDDRERFHRPAALIANAAGGAKMADLLKWLAHDLPSAPPEDLEEEVKPGELSVADRNTIASLGIKPPKAKPPTAAKKGA